MLLGLLNKVSFRWFFFCRSKQKTITLFYLLPHVSQRQIHIKFLGRALGWGIIRIVVPNRPHRPQSQTIDPGAQPPQGDSECKVCVPQRACPTNSAHARQHGIPIVSSQQCNI